MSDPNIEIDLDELLKDVTVPSTGTTQGASAPRTPDFSILDDIPVNTSSFNVPTAPDISALDDILMLSKHKESVGEKEREAHEVDLTLKEFADIKDFFAEKPHSFFDSADFYKKSFI